MKLSDVKPGDAVLEWVGGISRPLRTLTVTAVTDERIICGEYQFDLKTGAEIDEMLPLPPGVVASYITDCSNNV